MRTNLDVTPIGRIGTSIEYWLYYRKKYYLKPGYELYTMTWTWYSVFCTLMDCVWMGLGLDFNEIGT